MGYQLATNSGDNIEVPQLIFSKLADTEDDWVRVALFVVATKETDPAAIARALRLKSADRAKEALLFWKGAGLLQTIADEPTPAAPKAKARVRLTTPQVTAAAGGDAAIATLVQEAQHIVGGVLSQNDTNILVSLYINDAMPIEMILLGLAHFVAEGKGVAYAEKVLLSWQREGIDTGDACEVHLHTLAQRSEREQAVGKLFGFTQATFTKGDRSLIATWYEQYGYHEDMIAEAIGYAGEKKTVRYVNGILRQWHTKGLHTVRDVMQQNAGNMQNVQASNPNAKNVLGKMRPAPVFHKKETSV